jgi:hypothetical protein
MLSDIAVFTEEETFPSKNDFVFRPSRWLQRDGGRPK